MFRIKLQVPPELVLPYIERIKTGVRGMGYVQLDDNVAWPAFLERTFPPSPDRGRLDGNPDQARRQRHRT